MSELKAYIWVDALRVRAQSGGAFVYIARKGDRDAGIVLLKVSTLDSRAVLYVPERSMELGDEAQGMRGERIWRAGEASCENDVDQRINKRAQYDPDIWVVEIEDKQGRHFLTETVIELPDP